MENNGNDISIFLLCLCIISSVFFYVEYVYGILILPLCVMAILLSLGMIVLGVVGIFKQPKKRKGVFNDG